jgi:signal transduction histidine kinase
MGFLREFPENYFDEIQELALLGFWEYSPKTHLLKCTDTVFDIHEIPRAEFLDFDKAINYFLPSHRDMVQRNFLDLLRRGKPYDIVGIIVTPSGKEKWVRSIAKPIMNDGVVIDVIGIFQDITKNKLLDSERERDKMRLNLSLSVTKIGVWEWDFDHDVLYWDDIMFELFDIRKGDFTGEFGFFEKLVFPEDRKTIVEELAKAMRTGSDFTITYRIRTPLGKVKHICARGKPDASHTEGKWLAGICWDTTKDVEVQDKLKRVEVRLIASARLSGLGEMAAGVAHEINNPLAIIQTQAESLKNRLWLKPYDPVKVSAGLQLIEATCGRIAKIITGLKSISQDSDNETFIEVSLCEVVDNVLGLVTELFKSKGIDVTVDHNETVLVLGKPPQLGQVLMNLLNNSVDALEGLQEKWIRVTISKNASTAFIRITDSGQGIKPGIQEKIMQPFFTTKQVGKGTGLGLSISKGMIESHHGILWFDKDSQHTSFVIELPLAMYFTLREQTQQNGPTD